MFFHGLQERRLGFGRRSVDFVGEEQVRKHRTLTENELGASRVPNHGAGDIGRHEVGGELDARHVDVERARQRSHEERLGHARHALEQGMPAGDESDDETGDRSVLTDDGLADFSLEGQEGLLGVLLGAAEGSARPAFARGGGVRDGSARARSRHGDTRRGGVRGRGSLGRVGAGRSRRRRRTRRGCATRRAVGLAGAGDGVSHDGFPSQRRRGRWRVGRGLLR